MTHNAHTIARSPFDALFDTQFDAAMLVDARSGRFLRANAAAEAMLGYSEAELRERTPTDIHPHELPRLRSFIQQVRRTGTWQADDLTCRRCDGEMVPAVVSAAAVIDGTDEQILLVVRDRREKRLADLGQAVRRLAHDLKNTLATAQLVSDRLGSHADERVRLSAESMTRALERAVELCRQTVNVGRATLPPPERERFLLSDLMEELEATVAGIGLSGYTLVDESADAVMLDADFDQAYRILMNLVRNGFDAGATRVAICGATDPDSGAARLSVRDNGPGLPEHVRDRLGREQPSGSQTGSGLGLMIARELCRNHGGKLEVAETGPEGTTFRVMLPAA